MNDSRIVPVFQALAEDIHALGVRTVFGLMSDDTAVFAVTLDSLGVRFVGARGAAGLTCVTAASPTTARQTLRDAVAAANRGSLAALLLPTNVQMMNVEVWGEATPPPLAAAQPAATRAQSIDAVVALLGKSRRPLIVAGMGAHRAGAKAALEALADKIGALLMTSARGKDMFHGHPYNLGILEIGRASCRERA